MVAGCNVVINLIGKRYETTHWSFKGVHCDLAEAIAMACEYVNVLQSGAECMPLIIGCGAAYITMSFICAPYVATMLEIS